MLTNDHRCMRKGQDSKCLLCAYSYANTDGKCQEPLIPMKGCFNYASEKVCLECVAGEYLDRDGVCNPLTEANQKICFMSYVSTSSCSHCRNSKLALNGKCPSHQSCSDKNCEVCYIRGRKEACHICKKGFYFVGIDFYDSPCLVQNEGSIGCRWSDSQSYCLSCDFGYYHAKSEMSVDRTDIDVPK